MVAGFQVELVSGPATGWRYHRTITGPWQGERTRSPPDSTCPQSWNPPESLFKVVVCS
jgi:hypothetical protein